MKSDTPVAFIDVVEAEFTEGDDEKPDESPDCVAASRRNTIGRGLIERARGMDMPSHPVWRWAFKWLFLPIMWVYSVAAFASIFFVGALAVFLVIVLILMALGINPP